MKRTIKIVEDNLPVVALVGRVNVGKSTLFNKMTETDRALTSGVAGTTRTSNRGIVTWRGKSFRLVDTGGLTFSEEVPLEEDIIEQTKVAIKEAAVIIFVVDLQDAILPQEKELSRTLLKRFQGKKPIYLVGNKADSPAIRLNSHNKEWFSLGLGEPFPVSGINGSGVGDLLDIVLKDLNKLKTRPKTKKEFETTKVAIIGKPNVGKSTLFNKIVGKNEVIVSPMAHTTREPHDTLVEFEKEYYTFVDTAGIRKKTKVAGYLEKQGVGKSLAAIRESDIVLFLIDASEPVTDQDKQLGGFLKEHAKSVIIVVNKWDLAEENTDTFKNEVKQRIYHSFPHLNYAPIIFISAESGYKTHQIYPILKRAKEERKIKIANRGLENFLAYVIKKHAPARGKGTRQPKLLGFKQIGTEPPVFELAVKTKTSLHNSYLGFLENRLRENFSFYAAPIVIKIRKIKR